jgi:hypothetical protein
VCCFWEKFYCSIGYVIRIGGLYGTNIGDFLIGSIKSYHCLEIVVVESPRGVISKGSRLEALSHGGKGRSGGVARASSFFEVRVDPCNDIVGGWINNI